MEISSSFFNVGAKDSLSFAKSLGLDSGIGDTAKALFNDVKDKSVDLLPKGASSVIGSASKGGTVNPLSGGAEVNPNNPNTNTPNSEMIVTGSYPEWSKGPMIGLASLLDICSPAGLKDIRDANKAGGKIEDPYCCDCGEGGSPVVGGGYILMKTLDKVRDLQKSRLSNYVRSYKSGKLTEGQALVGITGVLNNALHSNNGDLIPTAATLPIGAEGVKLTLKDATQRGDMAWIKKAGDALGNDTIGPIIGENMGTLSGGLLTRGDINGVQTLNGILPDWSKSIKLGAMSGKPSTYRMAGLTDAQTKDVLVASIVNDKRAVTA